MVVSMQIYTLQNKNYNPRKLQKKTTMNYWTIVKKWKSLNVITDLMQNKEFYGYFVWLQIVSLLIVIEMFLSEMIEHPSLIIGGNHIVHIMALILTVIGPMIIARLLVLSLMIPTISRWIRLASSSIAGNIVSTEDAYRTLISQYGWAKKQIFAFVLLLVQIFVNIAYVYAFF